MRYRFQTVTSAGTSALSPSRNAPGLTRRARTARIRLKPTINTMHPVQSASTLIGAKTASCLMAELYAIDAAMGDRDITVSTMGPGGRNLGREGGSALPTSRQLGHVVC
jgi:hypothetical protein